MKEDLIVLLKKIDALKSEIESMRPLPPEREGRIFQKLRLDWNFHSNAIEGNSLTYGETNAFLMEGLTAKGKPLKDHLDLKGHNEAIDFLRHFIDKNEEITERDIRELHKMILVEPYKSKAISPGGQPSEKTIQIGQYKTQPNHVQTATGEMFYFASPEETPVKMHDLMEWYRANRGTMHPVELAALFHYDFVRIHPFDDGNGRMSRLLMNFILMQFGFPPVVIKASKKAEYFYALRSADVGDKDVFVEYMAEQLIHSMEIYLRGARGEDISEADDLDKEIDLLVRGFGGNKEAVKPSNKIIKQLLTEVFDTIFRKIKNKLTRIAPLFNDCHTNVLIEDVGESMWRATHKDIEAMAKWAKINLGIQPSDEERTREFLEKVIEFDSNHSSFSEISDAWFCKNLKALRLSVYFEQFLKLQPFFDIHKKIDFRFNAFNYEIETRSSIRIFSYSHKPNEVDIEMIVKEFIEEIIEEIKQKTQKQ